MNQGYVKIYRKMLENPICTKDADHMAIWMYLLLNATHQEVDVIFSGKRITLKPGQLITGRDKIAKVFHITSSKTERVLKAFSSKIEQQIEQQTTPHGRLITILNWEAYQNSEQQSEQQVNNKWTTSEQQVNTNKNVRMKECKNNISSLAGKKPKRRNKAEDIKEMDNIYKKFVDFFNKKTGRNFRYGDKKAKSQLVERRKEGYTAKDFETAIKNCLADKHHKENRYVYLTPEYITRAGILDRYCQKAIDGPIVEKSVFERLNQD